MKSHIGISEKSCRDLGGKEAWAETDKGSMVNVWMGPGSAPPDHRYFCHGESLETYKEFGYTVFSGKDMDRVLKDEYIAVAPFCLEVGDIIAWPQQGKTHAERLSGSPQPHSTRHTARVKCAFVLSGKIVEGHTSVHTKNGIFEPPKDMWLEDVCKLYGKRYQVYRARKSLT